jgi:hypothetical protein
MVEIRRLPAESLILLFQIDRSERVEVHYIVGLNRGSTTLRYLVSFR